MKRALKKRVKAVLNNTPNSDAAPVEQLNETNHKASRRATTQAAMIGLAISMGATSLLVTRQSDQAQAAVPVGSQKAASTIPAVSDTEIKFVATKLESQAVSSASVPENPVIVEPTAVSQVPGLEAKWPVTATEVAVQIPTSEADKNAIYLQPQVEQGLNSNSLQSRLQPGNQLPETRVQQLSSNQSIAGTQPTAVTVATGNTVNNDVDAQLKAQQEFALNRLQEKSNRLRNSLAELRSEETQNVSSNRIEVAQPTTVADNTLPAQSEDATEGSQANLISRLKGEKQTSAPMQKLTTSAPTAPKLIAQSLGTTYEVRPGDTLAEIASQYGTSVSEIVKANNLTDPNQLQISQQLIIPTARAERNSYNQSTLAVQPPFVQPSSKNTVASSTVTSSTVASSLVSQPDLDANLPQVSQSPVVTNNSSAAISIPVVKDNQLQVNTPATTSSVTIPVPSVPLAQDNQLQTRENDLTSPISYGVGGENQLNNRVTKIPTNQKEPQKVARVKGNERLRSLQTEIERLREKYRAQESGVTVQTVNTADEAPVPVVVETGKEFAPARVNSQRNAVAIPVPTPVLPSYSEKPVKPQFQMRAARPMNEPMNPEFLPNQTNSAGNSYRNNPSGIRLQVPAAGTNATDSLGKMRGTRVSPALPPLAAVDLYLPKAVDQNTNPPSTSSASYIWPAKGVLTSGYGWRWGRMHRGIDIANGVGTPIYASAAGRVEKAGWNNGGYGNLVEIRHSDGSMTRYAHNSRILVQVGQEVEQGQTIAAMGSTGFSTGPHSHFEVHPAGKGAVNPIAFLPSQARL
ncbi:peptidoglycan DD-metalloendopeptidase family protein [Sphaerospermopsis aphanizomenoides BCCUSP55]|uniref:peptidoglycan DD-metalloendopeptidase family protein n=1 Tax=Sphaerospermopsis aphanizomenoides TaxID=459663 RepID=UPI000A59E52B|nr:peptidoglycan DD-metalloendopeptidase family protein [Sphaerospermopsis aphanizomenoides]MBK1986603.1 peptidoglycan DD-metalloendopeptidase family protein [Sphaerospermopsis aphanizomenoides BCCUSP55]